MKITSVEDFYKETSRLLPTGISREIGHFNIFNTSEVYQKTRETKQMPYNRRAYYKISLIKGHNQAEYADKVIEIKERAILFATPKVPYKWVPFDEQQSGYFCIFTPEFISSAQIGTSIDELPIFKSGSIPVFNISLKESDEIESIFLKMNKELGSDYAFKYDLLRNYVLELIHYGQKLQPATTLHPTHTASVRVSSFFAELLERQFPIESSQQQLQLRTPKDFADRLSVHVNHLNKTLKEATGKTTSELITDRIIQEAKILLKQTNWNISEIAYCLGFEELAHFSNFFRKKTTLSPVSFRS